MILKINRPNATWVDHSLHQHDYQDIYFSASGAVAESQHVAIQGNHLKERLPSRREFWIGEVGFGVGVNFSTTLKLLNDFPNTHLNYLSVENAPFDRAFLKQTYQGPLSELTEHSHWIQHYPLHPTAGFYRIHISPQVTLHLLLGDGAQCLDHWIPPAGFSGIDAWYLDGFAPSRNESAWSEEIIESVARLSSQGTTIATYSVASLVRERLSNAGFEITKYPGIGKKKHCLRGVFTRDHSERRNPHPWYQLPKTPLLLHTPITILGSGLAGACTARALAESGYKVQVLEPLSEVAAGASGNPAGIFMPHLSRETNDTSRFSLHAFQVFQRWFEKYGSDKLGRMSGVTEWINDQEAIDEHSLYPGLAQLTNDQRTLYSSSGWIHPKKWCEQMLTHSKISIETNSPLSPAFITELRTHSLVIIALGPKSQELLPPLSTDIKSMKGQLLHLPPDTLNTIPTHIQLNESYLIPLPDGSSVLGATFEQKNTSTDTDWDSLSQFQSEAFSQLSLAWKQKEFNLQSSQTRASIRAMAPDKLPLIGMIPDTEYYQKHYSDLDKGRKAHLYPPAQYLKHLMVHTGLGSRGITYACAGAELITEILTGSAIGMDEDLVNRLHPARFLIRGFKSRKIGK